MFPKYVFEYQHGSSDVWFRYQGLGTPGGELAYVSLPQTRDEVAKLRALFPTRTWRVVEVIETRKVLDL
jgi:hypothetical protein